MSNEECYEHLQPLPNLINDENESDSSADNDQLEIVSDTEEGENLRLCLNNYLNLDCTDATEASAAEGHEQNLEEKSIY